MMNIENELSPYDRRLLEVLLGPGAPDLEARVHLGAEFRGRSRERARLLDRLLIERVLQQARGLEKASALQQQLRQTLDQLLAPPWFSALFVRLLEEPGKPARAVVCHQGGQRVVNLAEEVSPGDLSPGDEVYLGRELSLIVERSPLGLPDCGETATFERLTADGRLVLRSRDEEVVVRSGAGVAPEALRPGDRVRWERAAYLALEAVESRDSERYRATALPDVGTDAVGGNGESLELLSAVLSAALVAPEAAARYGIGRRNSLLLCGPPGVGKTLMVRVAAAEITRTSGRPCGVFIVKPAEFESCWVGESERHVREIFAAAREAAENGGLSLIFLDEVEAVGRLRGNAVGFHADKLLAALLAEIDGFDPRSGVAVVAATNRKDLVDPALLERLSDVEIAVPRPDLRSARAIFAIHLGESLHYHANGASPAATREELIELAVSLLYSPNADNQLARLRLRDGGTRNLAARDLASGRLFEQICRAARRRALVRDLRGGESGVCAGDIEEAVADALRRLATSISPRNAHAYLDDLPADVDVVCVEPVERRVARPHRYRRAS